MLVLDPAEAQIGGTASVYPGFSSAANCAAAIKIGDGSKESDNLIRNEFEVLGSLADVSFVPRVYEVTRAVFPKAAGRSNALMLKEEWLTGVSLGGVVGVCGPLPEDFLCALAYLLFSYGAQLHERGIMHRDLHMGNVFLCTDGQVKFIDFGFACPFEGADRATLVNGVQPPEVLCSSPCWTPASDVYMLACSLMAAFSGNIAQPIEFGPAPMKEWLAICTAPLPRNRYRDFRCAANALAAVVPPPDFDSLSRQCATYALTFCLRKEQYASRRFP